MIKPIVPATAAKLEKMLGLSFEKWPEAEELLPLVRSINLNELEPLFKKIEVDPANEDLNQKYK